MVRRWLSWAILSEGDFDITAQFLRMELRRFSFHVEAGIGVMLDDAEEEALAVVFVVQLVHEREVGIGQGRGEAGVEALEDLEPVILVVERGDEMERGGSGALIEHGGLDEGEAAVFIVDAGDAVINGRADEGIGVLTQGEGEELGAVFIAVEMGGEADDATGLGSSERGVAEERVEILALGVAVDEGLDLAKGELGAAGGEPAGETLVEAGGLMFGPQVELAREEAAGLGAEGLGEAVHEVAASERAGRVGFDLDALGETVEAALDLEAATGAERCDLELV